MLANPHLHLSESSLALLSLRDSYMSFFMRMRAYAVHTKIEDYIELHTCKTGTCLFFLMRMRAYAVHTNTEDYINALHY